MKINYLTALDKTVISFSLKIAELHELPPLMAKRKDITNYEFASFFDVTAADNIIRRVKESVGVTERIPVAFTYKKYPDGLYLHYALHVNGEVNTDLTDIVGEEVGKLEKLLA